MLRYLLLVAVSGCFYSWEGAPDSGGAGGTATTTGTGAGGSQGGACASSADCDSKSYCARDCGSVSGTCEACEPSNEMTSARCACDGTNALYPTGCFAAPGAGSTSPEVAVEACDPQQLRAFSCGEVACGADASSCLMTLSSGARTAACFNPLCASPPSCNDLECLGVVDPAADCDCYEVNERLVVNCVTL